MANYAVIDYATDRQNTVAKALAIMETYLETIDSTTNEVIEMGVVPVGGEFIGWIIHKG
jgi:hypothetical protein